MASDWIGSRVLILGGTGFIGRHMVKYLLKNELTSKIRVVDKTPVEMAWMNEEHKAFMEKVEFVQVNLNQPTSCPKAFDSDDGEFDVVINLAAETKFGQYDGVYEESILKVGINCSREAAKRNIKKYIELSTGQVYSYDKKASKEDSKLSPWTGIAKYKLQLEEELAKIEGLNYIILRPAIVYGIGDKTGLTPRLVIGAVYRELQEKMKLLWTADLNMHTVHVEDVCHAIWFVINHGQLREVYNVVDKSQSTQGSITELVCSIFHIEHDYFGSVMSNLAKLNLSDAVEESNDKHTGPWSELCKREDIQHTPLSPYLDQELLYNKHLRLDGSKLEKLGFELVHPEVREQSLKEVVEDYITMKIFPKSVKP
ncbi:dTDP-D-glucose 4,6-dehydratase [Holothuria leucospilota]|uniref:dTDP-D-glucose 4,6-dehydratase n=1 Tax=Holothuria leucospilota TaxID=206669 RepID=A0A9Q1H7X2_HOLLE|nr:dTDP-D-glucose 4,6-dehydratase [Holothuria leucospilota]